MSVNVNVPHSTCMNVSVNVNVRAETADGLCCKLGTAAPRTFKPPVKFKDFEVSRVALAMARKLGAGSFGEVWHGTHQPYVLQSGAQ